MQIVALTSHRPWNFDSETKVMLADEQERRRRGCNCDRSAEAATGTVRKD